MTFLIKNPNLWRNKTILFISSQNWVVPGLGGSKTPLKLVGLVEKEPGLCQFIEFVLSAYFNPHSIVHSVKYSN